MIALETLVRAFEKVGGSQLVDEVFAEHDKIHVRSVIDTIAQRCCRNPTEFLLQSFRWSDTRRGFDGWAQILKKLPK